MVDINVLVVNCGSSSLKFAVVSSRDGAVLREGLAERLGTDGARLRIDAGPMEPLDRSSGAAAVLGRIASALQGFGIAAVGHRVVHGGELFSDSVLIDERALTQIRECVKLAPLHNPANLQGIEAAQAQFPDVPHVAVFDTAFHQTLPPKAYFYAVPYALYEQHGVRRYGFHGTSHRYVASEAARRLGKPLEALQLITAHLGNGCSTCAVKDGRSVDTSMGLTPLEGLVMGTRSGDVDPNLHEYLANRTGQSLSEITRMLNHESGLLGLSGRSNDMRTVLEASANDPRARLALDVFCYRLAKSILASCAPLDRVDALVFTGGIGEHAAPVRAETLSQLAVLGAELDPELNRSHGQDGDGRITTTSSRLLALVVPTNEELVIAREAARFVR